MLFSQQILHGSSGAIKDGPKTTVTGTIELRLRQIIILHKHF